MGITEFIPALMAFEITDTATVDPPPGFLKGVIKSKTPMMEGIKNFKTLPKLIF